MNLFTPRRVGREERLSLRLSDEDMAKIKRGVRWEATVTDLDTGKVYKARSSACTIPGCYCDAIARPLR